MKKYLMLFAAGLTVFAACNNKEKEGGETGEGPDVTVTCPESALMGDDFSFSVNIEDKVALSTLKVELLFDETVVAESTIRTAANGVYEGTLSIPFYKNIPDGVATARFTAQNTSFAKTVKEFDVAVSRPDFEYLTLIGADGTQYKMNKVSRNNYAIEGSFGASFDAQIETAPFGTDNRKLVFGYGSTGVEVGASGMIPFASASAEYTVSFNTLTFEAAPFTTITVNGTVSVMSDKTHFAAVIDIQKGAAVKIEGIEDIAAWTADPDFIETADDGSMKFLAADGKYKISISLQEKYFLVERMASETDYARLDSEGSGAVWMIGGANCYGKPSMFKEGWKTQRGLCLAEVEPKVHQLTLIAGEQLSASSIDVKLFHQKDWGGEFGGNNPPVTTSKLITVGASDGNIHLASGVTLDVGGIYRFTLDLTGGVNSPKLAFEKVGQKEIGGLDISFAGTKMTQMSSSAYQALVSLTQGQNISISGISSLSGWTIDPDLFSVSGSAISFVPVTGYYLIELDTAKQYISGGRRNEDGSYPASMEDGGLYLVGYGVAAVSLDSEIDWTATKGHPMAEISPKVFQFTAMAGAQGSSVAGIRIRYDYLSMKYLMKYDSWDRQTSKGLEFGGNTGDKLKQTGDGNIELDSSLEEGAVYRLTVDFSGGGEKEMVTFEKL